jgi:hypothetical protein
MISNPLRGGHGVPLSSDYSSYSRKWTWATYFTAEVSPITLSNHDTHDADMATAIDTLAGLLVQSIPVGGVTGQVLAKASGTDRDTEWVDINTGAGGGTDLTWTAGTRTLSSNTGADAVITLATTDDPGLMSAAQFDKLDGIEASATADQTAAEIVALIDASATEEQNLVTAIIGNATARGALFASASGDIDSGAFAAGAVNLTTDVTGDLPFANFVAAGSAGFIGATGAGDYAHRTISQTKGDLSIDDLVTLSGVSDGDTHLGTFTGSTIPDSQTTKQALQALETAVEAAGELVYIGSVTASNDATVEFSGLSSTYSKYVVEIEDLVPASDASTLHIRTSTDNGSTFDSGASDYQYNQWQAGSGITVSRAGAAQIILFSSCGTGTGEAVSGSVEILRPSATTYTKVAARLVGLDSTANFGTAIVGGLRASAADVDAIQFLMNTGNIASGTFRLYGVRAS